MSNAAVVESSVVPALLTLLCSGQMLLKVAAKVDFSDGSMSTEPLKSWILFWNDEQWANPSVCPPTNLHQQDSHLYINQFSCKYYIYIYAQDHKYIEIYIPERATRSSKFRPLWEKLCCNWEMLKTGAGNCLVSPAFEILPSFLPFGTCQVGPPD